MWDVDAKGSGCSSESERRDRESTTEECAAFGNMAIRVDVEAEAEAEADGGAKLDSSDMDMDVDMGVWLEAVARIMGPCE